MKNLLFLRGKVDKRTETTLDINKHTDMWTQVAREFTNHGYKVTILYWGGTWFHKYTDNLREVWVPNLKDYNNKPDLIFARGGFPEYDYLVHKYITAKQIYYGAGVRTVPHKNHHYDLVIVDDLGDVSRVKGKHPKSTVWPWFKPAADNVFKPLKMAKTYNVCFPANGTQPFKGFKYVYSSCPKDLSILNLGYPQKKVKIPDNVYSIRVPRQEMPEWYNKCRVGIVCTSDYDSHPRVISEMLACGLPVVALDRVRFRDNHWAVKRPKDSFWQTVRGACQYNLTKKVYDYYIKRYSVKIQVKKLLELL